MVFSSCTSFFECVDGTGELIQWDTAGTPALKIESSINADITYRVDAYSNQTSLSISAEQNLLDLIVVRFERNSLEIDAPQCLNSKKGIRVEIRGPNPERIVIEGQGRFQCENLVETKKLQMEINGSGSINLSAKANEIKSVVYGSGTYHLSGNTNYFEPKIIGSGEIDAKALESQDVYAKINGSGSMKLWAVEQLEIKINGSGNVGYKGNPGDLIQRIKGSGSAEKL